MHVSFPVDIGRYILLLCHGTFILAMANQLDPTEAKLAHQCDLGKEMCVSLNKTEALQTSFTVLRDAESSSVAISRKSSEPLTRKGEVLIPSCRNFDPFAHLV